MSEHRTAILHITDTHDGKKTKSFDQDILAQRMDALSEKLYKIRQRLSFHIERFIIILTGDINDGVVIYPTQQHHQDETDALEQVDQASNLIFSFATDQQETWGCPVTMQCVAGNHGRAGRFHHEETNWDILTYRTMSTMAQFSPQIDVDYGKDNQESKFLRVFKVNNTGILLYHGHGIRMYQSIPRYGIVQRIMRWSTTEALGDWRYMFLGHFHRCEYFSQNQRACFMGGTMVTDDDWALEVLGYESDPHWWLLLMQPNGDIEEQFKLKLI